MTKFCDLLSRWTRKELSALDARQILGCSDRQFRHYRGRYEEEGLTGVVDKRAISASIVGTANAQGKIYGLPTAAYAMAPTSTVTHNGSLMEVYDRGGRMEIRYADPRPGLTNIGVRSGARARS
jgi:hypothetical protein